MTDLGDESRRVMRIDGRPDLGRRRRPGRAVPRRNYGGSSLNTVSLPWEAWLDPASALPPTTSTAPSTTTAPANARGAGSGAARTHFLSSSRSTSSSAFPLACDSPPTTRIVPSRTTAPWVPARRDRRTRRPRVRLGVDESTSPKSSEPLRPPITHSLPSARPRRGCPSPAAAAPPAPAVRRRVVDGVEVERRDRVAAADDVDLAVDDRCGVAAPSLGKRCRLAPALSLDVVDMHRCRCIVGRVPKPPIT